MGLNDTYLKFIVEHAIEALGTLAGKRMLELGNQTLRRGSEYRTGKAYFESLDVEHVSIDLNGRHGSLVYDLSKGIDVPSWVNYFDIETNAGTTEHVEPHGGQYECFRTLHRFLKVGGIAVHIVPDSDELKSHRRARWRNHCNNYYSHAFFAMLADKNDYELRESKEINQNRLVCLRKIDDVDFMADRELFLSLIYRRE